MFSAIFLSSCRSADFPEITVFAGLFRENSFIGG
jgi:hypothetical protein